MINKLLIANRGEIACRIIKTAKSMGIESIAIYSSVDTHAQHVKQADFACYVGPAPSSQSYLDRNKIIALAQEHKVDAIHPGYGFLSEDAQFAELCLQNNIIFVGPSPKALKQMGDKALAKQLMQQAGVPCTPSGDDVDFPLLIKAVAGGGGKGMRLVTKPEDFEAALIEAKKEALASFGNDEVIIEKYLKPSRHVEVQVFADNYGNTVHLFDRDCSLQRRHQKIIEEAPAPGLSEHTRANMSQAAINAAKAINYSGAGTIEFLVTPDEQFYFMEMNTRLQVEHPVTEMITGLDLVEWQLRVANNEKLPLNQTQIKKYGHAFEARICAENPQKNFAPDTGQLQLLRFSNEARVDSGVIEKDHISPYYDPLIAKLIVHGDDRDQALHKLQQALQNTFISGLNTNISHLSKLCRQPEMISATISTDYSIAIELQPNDLILQLASLALQHKQQTIGKTRAKFSLEPNSPWYDYSNWQPNYSTQPPHWLWYDSKLYEIPHCPGTTEWQDDIKFIATINNQKYHVAAFVSANSLDIFYDGEQFTFRRHSPKKQRQTTTAKHNLYLAPMPASIVEIYVSPGQKVQIGDKLMVLEAMKMQHTIKAETDGIIKDITHQEGDLLMEGDLLLEIE